MNPTIWAAIISGGWAAIVALAGFRNTRNSTAATVAANSRDIRAQIEASSASLHDQIEADRHSRYWEKRAAAYEAILAAFQHRSLIRHFHLGLFRPDQPDEKTLEEFSKREPPGWYEAVGRLLAYGSDDVLTAYQAAQDADRMAGKAAMTWRTLGEQRQAIDEALEVAEQKEQALLQLIRSELRSRPDIDR